MKWQASVLASLLLVSSLALGQSGAGVITTIAGSTPASGPPARGFSGDGGPATSAALALANLQNECDPGRFEQTAHIFVDSAGNVYFPDSNNQRIRRISPQGIITTIGGTGERPPINARCEPTGGTAAIGDGGPVAVARFYNPADVVVAPNGNLITADQQNNRIRQVTPAGVITTIVGNGMHNLYAPNIPALNSPMDWPGALALDASGTLYFAEIHSNRVARIGADGRIVTVAGTGFPGFDGDNKPATTAQLRNPTGIGLDAAGNLYVADQLNHRIRKVTPAGVISTVAGTGQPGFSGDGGRGENAALNQPADVKVDARGNIYIADMLNHRIRRIDPAGIITTVAGDGRSGRGPDGIAAIASSLNSPSGIALDASGDLYVVDWMNYLIRKISFSSQPAITPGYILNAASFAPYPVPVAPGSIISIFGVNMASSTLSASELPLPTTLGDTSVTVNGAPIPLFYVSPGQINAQLPYDLSNGEANAIVATAAGASKPEVFNVAPSAVGIFQFAGTTRAVVLNQDGSVNSPETPASVGTFIVAFLTGQGAVTPAVPAGQAAPFDTLSRAALPVSATIGNSTAPVAFLGLAPGFIGLAQANLQVPVGTPAGREVLLVISVGGQASNTTTISVR